MATGKKSALTKLKNQIDKDKMIHNKKISMLAKAAQKKQVEDGTYVGSGDRTSFAAAIYTGSLKTRPNAAKGIKGSEMLVASRFKCDGCGDDCPYRAPNGTCNLELERYKIYEKNLQNATMRDVMKHNMYRMMSMSDFIYEHAKKDKYKKMYQPLVNLQRTISDQMKDMRQYEEGKQITIEYKVTKELDAIRDLTGEVILTAEFSEIDEGIDIDVGKVPDDSPLKPKLKESDFTSQDQD